MTDTIYDPPLPVCVQIIERSILEAQALHYDTSLQLAALGVAEGDVETLGARKAGLEMTLGNARKAIDVLYARLAALGGAR